MLTNVSTPESIEKFPNILHGARHKELIFASDRENDTFQFYRSEFKRSEWHKPEVLKVADELVNVTSPFVSYDQSMILFSASKEDDNFGGTDLYYIEKYGNRLGKIHNFGSVINSEGNELFPSLSADGKSLYFARIDDDSDFISFTYTIYVAHKNEKGEWQSPVPLPAPVNLNSEKAPLILEDNRTLLYAAETSSGNMDYDVFASVLQPDGSWSNPIALDFINTDQDDYPPSIDLKENMAYFIKNNDIFSTAIPDNALPQIEEEEIPEMIASVRNVENTNTVVIDEWDMGDLDFDVKDYVEEMKYYALIIGVQDYQDQGIQDLEHPLRDAEDMKNTLVNHYTFEEENITVVSNPTRSELIQAFDGLMSKVRDIDNVLIFYAGHGYWDSKKEVGYWLPVDAHPKSSSNWFSNSRLKEYLKGLPAQHTLLVTDACFSGSIFRTRAAFASAPRTIRKRYELPSRKAMTSGALKEVPDKSIFLSYLIKRLENNHNEFLPAEQLFDSMKDAIINNSENLPQYGTVHGTGDEGGDFIFIKR
ncbi:hypothetical protein GCM10023331_17600 [Algivirga pacifica]|uniref:Peptidase C14 caspase domain-containing protein n=1 Tax=Algivirga pacifica TaxID=1162670 RepID=A0ABP9DC20_9BACT